MCTEDLTTRCTQPHDRMSCQTAISALAIPTGYTPSSPSPSSPSEFTVAKSCTTGRRDSHVMMTLTTLWANLLRVQRLNQRIRQRTNSGVCAMDPEIEFGIMTARRFRCPAVPQLVGAARQSTHAKTRTKHGPPMPAWTEDRDARVWVRTAPATTTRRQRRARIPSPSASQPTATCQQMARSTALQPCARRAHQRQYSYGCGMTAVLNMRLREVRDWHIHCTM